MNRIDRVSAILIHLQSKKSVTAEEIAQRFEISKRTVYRDLKALEEAGVPVGAEPGRGYFLIDGYHLPPVMFSTKEASALLTAEKIMEKIADHSINDQYKSAMYKIRAVLPDKEKNYLDRLDNNIEILHASPAVTAHAPNNYILDIQRALVDRKVVSIDYQAGYNEEVIKNRQIEPVGVCFYSMGWHLIGFCRYRNDYRDFRIDRILVMKVTDETCQIREIKSIKEFFAKMQSSFKLERIVIRFPKSTANLIRATRYYYGFISEEEKENFVELNFMVSDTEYFSRWLLMYSDVVEIISPESLRENFLSYIKIIKKRFI